MSILQPLPHGELVLTRRVKAGRATCFRAWAELEHRQQWFVGPEGWRLIERKLDLREGGEEILHGGTDSFESKYSARFHRIIADAQLVYAFDMHVNGEQYSISLAAVDFEEKDGETEVSYVEKIFYMAKDYDHQGRLDGTNKLLDNFLAYMDKIIPS